MFTFNTTTTTVDQSLVRSFDHLNALWASLLTYIANRNFQAERNYMQMYIGFNTGVNVQRQPVATTW